MRLTPIVLLAVTTCAPRPDPSPSAAVAPAPAPVEAPAPAPTPAEPAEPAEPAAPAVTIPSEGPGSLECCEAIETAGPAVEVSAMISAVERAGFACLELADAKSAQRAVSACIRKLGRATVKACVVVDDPEMPSCAAQTYAATVDDRVLLGLGSDLQLEDYGWSVVELRAGEAHVLYPHGAPYVNPYCDDEEAREPGRDAELAKIPAHVERAPEAVRRWICSGPPG